MTKRTVLLLALAATTGIPAMAACSTAERQAPLPPQAAGPASGASSLPSSTVAGGGTAVPQAADGSALPSSGTVGANVAPGTPDSTGGLRTRPGYAPGSATTASAVPDGYRIGARAPWGILLDDRPQPEPLPVPLPGPAPHQTGDARQDNQKQPAPPAPPAGGGVTILADGPAPLSPAVKMAPTTVADVALPPGQAKRSDDTAPVTDAPEQGLPSSVSFASLLSVLPPVATPTDPLTDPTSVDPNSADKPGKGPKVKHPHGPQATPEGTAQPTPAATPLTVPSPLATLLPPSPSPTSTPSPQPAASQPTSVQPAPMPAAGWHIDGLALQQAAPAPTGKGGSPAFRKALRAALAARPDGARPGPAALRAWSASLQKAAALAPDARTKAQLHTLARYARELAGVAGPKRNALQAKRPGALDAASALRAALPRRFGVALLG